MLGFLRCRWIHSFQCNRIPMGFLKLHRVWIWDTSLLTHLRTTREFSSAGLYTEDSFCLSKNQHRLSCSRFCHQQKRTIHGLSTQSVLQVGSKAWCLRYFISSISCLTFCEVKTLERFQNYRGNHSLTRTVDSGIRPTHQLIRTKSGKSVPTDDEDDEELADDDYDAPTTFRKITIHVKSLRADSVVSSALDVSRNKVDELFYSSRLRLNGETLLKKSKQIDEGDFVDLIQERSTQNEGEIMVKRVKIIAVSEERTNKDKVAVTVKVWKGAFPIKDETKTQW